MPGNLYAFDSLSSFDKMAEAVLHIRQEMKSKTAVDSQRNPGVISPVIGFAWLDPELDHSLERSGVYYGYPTSMNSTSFEWANETDKKCVVRALNGGCLQKGIRYPVVDFVVDSNSVPNLIVLSEYIGECSSGSGGSGDGPPDDGNRTLIGYYVSDVQCISGRTKIYRAPLYQYANGIISIGDSEFWKDAGCCHCGSGENIIDIPCCTGREMPATLYATFQTDTGDPYETQGSGELFWDGDKWTGTITLPNCNGKYIVVDFYPYDADGGSPPPCHSPSTNCIYTFAYTAYDAEGAVLDSSSVETCVDKPNCEIDKEFAGLITDACYPEFSSAARILITE